MTVGPWHRGTVAPWPSLGPSVPLSLVLLVLLTAPARAQDMDSVVAAARRTAVAWARHDFSAAVPGGGTVVVQLPGSAASAPLRPAQAAELLRGFTSGATEARVEVAVARRMGTDQAYAELTRVYRLAGGARDRQQTVYLGLRQEGAAFMVREVRVVD